RRRRETPSARAEATTTGPRSRRPASRSTSSLNPRLSLARTSGEIRNGCPFLRFHLTRSRPKTSWYLSTRSVYVPRAPYRKILGPHEDEDRWDGQGGRLPQISISTRSPAASGPRGPSFAHASAATRPASSAIVG